VGCAWRSPGPGGRAQRLNRRDGWFVTVLRRDFAQGARTYVRVRRNCNAILSRPSWPPPNAALPRFCVAASWVRGAVMTARAALSARPSRASEGHGYHHKTSAATELALALGLNLNAGLVLGGAGRQQAGYGGYVLLNCSCPKRRSIAVFCLQEVIR
jgi:hypothetical protein